MIADGVGDGNWGLSLGAKSQKIGCTDFDYFESETILDDNSFVSTCYIVGAGASADFSFPTGEGLVTRISDLLRVNRGSDSAGLANREAYLLHELLCQEFKGSGKQPKLQDYELVARSMPLAPSIDNFLEAHASDPILSAIGKVAIANEILKAERRSALFFDPYKSSAGLDFSNVRGTWLSVLFRQINAGVGWEGFKRRLKSTYFICFNYDRLIERFFFLAAMQYFQLDEQEASNAISENLNIVHPYGKTGKDVFSVREGDFGGSGGARTAFEASKHIRTFTEGLAETECSGYFSNYLNSANVLCFLGFGFHRINLDHLNGAGKSRFNYVLATAYQVSDNYVQISKGEIRKELASTNSEKVIFENSTCAKLLLDYSAMLSGRGAFEGAVSRPLVI